MHTKMSRIRRIALGGAVVLGSAGIGGASFAALSGGGASATTSTNTPATGTPATGTPSAKGQKVHQFIRRHTVDATFTIKTKNGYETLDLARGTVGSISPTSITVDSPNGSTLTASITSATKFHNTSVNQLANGDKVGVLASNGVARSISAPKAPASGPTS